MKELLEFHEQFYASLVHSSEIEELADCFVNNSAQISDLYVDYCKGKEKSQQIIEEKSAGYFTKIHKVHFKVFSGDSDVGDFMMVTDFRCWWQNHYVGDFFSLCW